MKSILEGILRNYRTLQPIYAFITITTIFLAEKYFGKIKVQIYCSDPKHGIRNIYCIGE